MRRMSNMGLQELEARWNVLDRRTAEDVGRLKALVEQSKEASALAAEDREYAQAAAKASGFMNSFADERLSEVHKRLEGLVTHALQQIFGDGLVFKIVTETKASRSETRFVVVSQIDGQPLETGVMDARGGGVAAVVGFIVKLLLVLLTPGARRVMFLDETFAQLSTDYEPRMASFMRELADKAGVQLILVTHSDAYSDSADKVYRFSNEKGVTKVETVRRERAQDYHA